MNLVTGATGLLGSHLIYKLLTSGKKVRAIKRNTSNISHLKNIFSIYSENYEELFERIEWIEADLLDIHSLMDAMQGVKNVYHCAALVSFIPEDKEKLMKTNAEGTANIVNAALEMNINKLCYASSIACLGRIDANSIITENSYWKPSADNSNYSVSKYLAEIEVQRGINEGLNAVIVRPSIIFGPGFWNKGSSELIKTIHNGLSFYPVGINGFVDVRDVSDIMIKLTESDISSEDFIVSAENLSYKDIFSIIAQNLNTRPPYIKVGNLFTKLYLVAHKIVKSILRQKPAITSETAKTAQQKFIYSNQKIVKTLNYNFIPVSETLKFISKYFSEHTEKKTS